MDRPERQRNEERPLELEVHEVFDTVGQHDENHDRNQ